MAQSKAYPGVNARLAWVGVANNSQGAAAKANLIDGCRNFSGPSTSVSSGDASTNESRWMKSIPTQIDPGVLAFELLWNPADEFHKNAATAAAPSKPDKKGLLYIHTHLSTEKWRLVHPSDATKYMEFEGWISGWDWQEPSDGVAFVNVELKVSGEIDYNHVA